MFEVLYPGGQSGLQADAHFSSLHAETQRPYITNQLMDAFIQELDCCWNEAGWAWLPGCPKEEPPRHIAQIRPQDFLYRIINSAVVRCCM